MMTDSRCGSCNIAFKNKAALNFHRKKSHGEIQKNSEDHSSQPLVSDPGESESTSDTEKQLKKRRMVQFADESGILDPDGPFIVRLCGSARQFMKQKEQEPESYQQSMEPGFEGEASVIVMATTTTTTTPSEVPLAPIPLMEPEPPEIPPVRGKKRKKPESSVPLLTGQESGTSTPQKISADNVQNAQVDSAESQSSSSSKSVPVSTPSKKRREGRSMSTRSRTPSLVSDDNLSSVSGSSQSSASSKRSGTAKVCPVCDKTDFKNQYWFRNHLEIHEGKRPFVCPTCEWGCETDIQLLEHVSRSHSLDVTFFNCENEGCDKKYKTKRRLESHRCAFRRADKETD